MIFKQFGGITAVGSFASVILELAGTKKSNSFAKHQEFSVNVNHNSNLLLAFEVSGFSSGKFGTIVIASCQVFNKFPQWLHFRYHLA